MAFGPNNLRSLAGIFLIIGICWAVSENRRRFPWRLALGATALQAGLVVLMFGVPSARAVLAAMSDAVDNLAAATATGV